MHERREGLRRISSTRTLAASFLAFALCVVMQGCGPRDARYDPQHFRVHGLLVPPDVALPRNTRAASDIGGLYVIDEGSKGLCCWIAMRAHLLVHKNKKADYLYIGAFMPAAGGNTALVQRVTVAFPSAHVRQVPPPFPVGSSRMLRVPVPAALRGITGEVPVDLYCAISYQAPKGVPRYGMILQSIYFD